MDWPSNSPDLNPMENLWRVMKYKVRNSHPQNASELEEAIHLALKSFPQKLAWNYVNNMPTRIQKVIEAKGDSIDY